MVSSASVVFRHIGICVRDIERSARFYEALGFEFEHAVEVGPPFHHLTELPAIKAKAQFFRLGETRIELLEYLEPGHVGAAERRPMNQLGFTHMTLIVDDLQAVMTRVEAHGGQVLRERLASTALGDFVFSTDPDGVRIELWQKPATS